MKLGVRIPEEHKITIHSYIDYAFLLMPLEQWIAGHPFVLPRPCDLKRSRPGYQESKMAAVPGIICLLMVVTCCAGQPVMDCLPMSDSTAALYVADTSDVCTYHVCGVVGDVTYAAQCPWGAAVPDNLDATADPRELCRGRLEGGACGRRKRRAEGDGAAPLRLVRVHLAAGGVLQPGVSRPGYGDEARCLLACRRQSACRAADYHNSTGRCYLHGTRSTCEPLVPRANSVHFRLQPLEECTQGTLLAGSVSPTTTPQPIKPIGFEVEVQSASLPSGSLSARDVSLPQCLAICRRQAACLAVDYHWVGGRCVTHGRGSACGPLLATEGATHFKRFSCLMGLPLAAEVYPDAHVHGGRRVCVGCTVQQCLRACHRNHRCLSVDYNHRHSTCYEHLSATGCGALVPTDSGDVTHLKVHTCVSAPLLPLTPPTPRLRRRRLSCPQACPLPTDPVQGATFTAGSRPLPSALPAGWLAYPGGSTGGGGLVVTNRTGDGCVQACLQDPTCKAVDYDSESGHCHLVSRSHLCRPLDVKGQGSSYHMKRQPCPGADVKPIPCFCDLAS